jgi:hypothetical protein
MTHKLIKTILMESAIAAIVKKHNEKIESSSAVCQRAIKNGPNYPQQVAHCTSAAKIRILRSLLANLNNLRGSGVSQKELETRIINTKLRLDGEMKRYSNSKSVLLARLRTIPVSLSNKPSPERYESGKIQ